MNRRTTWLLIIFILLFGAGIRLHGLTRDSRLHGDESLFASFGRQMIAQGDWNLYETPIDKPPTTFALVGLSTALVGESEFAVRLPNALASILSLALIYAITRRLYNVQSGLLALTLLALSPLAIAYAPTAFQDPLMMVCVLASLVLMLGNQWAWGGFMLGMAFAMKPTALYLAPLIMMMALLWHQKMDFRNLRNVLLGALLPVVLLILWDQSRIAQSFFALGRNNNNPGRFIRSDEVVPRLEAWLAHFSNYAAFDVVSIGFALLLVIGLGRGLQRRARGDLVLWWLVTFGVGYFGFHWLVAFPIYDRYLLPLLPFALMGVAAGLNSVLQNDKSLTIGVIAVLMFVGFLPARDALHQTDPINVNDTNIVADLLENDYQGQVVYDFALDWPLRWYLPPEPSFLLVYFPTPEDLAQHMQHDEGLRYLIAPSAKAAEPWLFLLAAYDVHMTQIVYDQGNIVLYELSPPLVSSTNTGMVGSGSTNNPN